MYHVAGNHHAQRTTDGQHGQQYENEPGHLRGLSLRTSLGGIRFLVFPDLGPLGRRYPGRFLLELVTYLKQLGQVHPVAVAAECAHLMLVGHHDGVEVTHLYANPAKYAPVEIDLEAINDLSTTTFPLGLEGEI